MTEQLHSMITGGRANVFARFKFSEKLLKRKENGILRLLLNDRSMARGKDSEGFIGHKTTAKLDRIASPLSWTASAQNPLRNSKSRCGTREISQRKTTPKGKDRRSGFKDRSKTKSKGQPAAPFRPKVNRPPNRKRTVTERPNLDRSSSANLGSPLLQRVMMTPMRRIPTTMILTILKRTKKVSTTNKMQIRKILLTMKMTLSTRIAMTVTMQVKRTMNPPRVMTTTRLILLHVRINIWVCPLEVGSGK